MIELRCCRVFVALVLFLFCGLAHGAFYLEDNGETLSVREDASPVLEFRYGGGGGSSIHPLYGLSGEVVTGGDDAGGGEHAGVFWAWGNCSIGSRELDLWDGVGARKAFERWIVKSAGDDRVELALQNVWLFSDSGAGGVLEDVSVTVWAAERNRRLVDVRVEFRNVSSDRMVLNGGEGGFCVRMGPELKGLELSGGQGGLDPSGGEVLSPWVDVSYRDARHSTYSGMAVFQHRSNPGFARPNWRFEPGGVLCAGLNRSERVELKPGESLAFGYRLFLHRGYGPNLGLNGAYSAFLRGSTE